MQERATFDNSAQISSQLQSHNGFLLTALQIWNSMTTLLRILARFLKSRKQIAV
jgi:hypothetical protein